MSGFTAAQAKALAKMFTLPEVSEVIAEAMLTVLKEKGALNAPSVLIGKYVVVRTYSAGVHTGTLASKNGKEVTLINSHRIWSWTQPDTNDGALSGVANHGVGPGSKIAGPVSVVELTEAIEVLECTGKSESSIKNGKWTS